MTRGRAAGSGASSPGDDFGTIALLDPSDDRRSRGFGVVVALDRAGVMEGPKSRTGAVMAGSLVGARVLGEPDVTASVMSLVPSVGS